MDCAGCIIYSAELKGMLGCCMPSQYHDAHIQTQRNVAFLLCTFLISFFLFFSFSSVLSLHFQSYFSLLCVFCTPPLILIFLFLVPQFLEPCCFSYLTNVIVFNVYFSSLFWTKFLLLLNPRCCGS